VEPTLPRLPRFGQFRIGGTALGKRPNGFSCGQMCGYFQDFRQVRDGAGGDYVIFALSAFRLSVKDAGIDSERLTDLVEKVGP
jgi:hypothetical protein